MRINTLNPLNRNWSPNNGLVMRLLALPHNSGGRQWLDVAGGNHGTLTNGPTWPSMRRDNSFGCVKLDGSNDTVDIGALTDTDSLTQMSVSCWVKINTLVDFASFIYRGGGASQRWSLGCSGAGINSNTAVLVTMSNSAANSYAWTTGNPLVAGVWQHVAFVFDGSLTGDSSRLVVYVNGLPQALYFTGSVPATTTTTSTTHALGTYAGSIFLNATLDDVCISKRAWTLPDIQAVYNDSRTGYQKSLNWIKPRVVTPAVASTNRIRRLITAGGS